MAAKQNESYVSPCCKSSRIPNKILCEELKVIRKRRKAVCCESSTKTQTAENSNKKNKTQVETNPNPKAGETKLRDKLVGLALSGGGIRSATFSLGVLQRLAKEGCLKHVDYLSTVSGGGYIGGSLTWLLSDKAKKLKKDGTCWNTSDKFPYGVEDPREERLRENEPNMLKHLRLHGKYLIPGNGITTTSLIAVILRGILLNLLVWLPLVVALMVVLMFVSCAIWHIGSFGGAISSWEAIWSAIKEICLACIAKNERGLNLLLYPAGLMGGVFLLVSILYSLSTRKPILKDPYLRRRKFEEWIRWVLWIGLGLLVVGSLPVVERWLGDYLEEVGVASVLLAIVSGVLSFRSDSNGKGKIPLGVLAPLASIPFFYGLALVSYKLALLYLGADPTWIKWVLLGGSVFIPLLTGWCVNLNYISIHRYYRDRLMEAFMPCSNTDGKPAAAIKADKAELSDMWSKHAPYHLVNTNVILVDSDDSRWRVRGGDAFLLSPKYCGSTATGWRKTACYMKKDSLTLATAVAIAGAAANPNTGAGGSGPTRKPLLSLLMALLNVRLGYWVPHPNPDKSKFRIVANHFRAAYHELSPRGYTEHQKLLQISDGGHFENLGVYELVRRKVKLIICCDGSADPEFSFSDLQVLVRRIGTDFGAKIKFDRNNHLERIIPRDPDPQKVIDRDPNTDAYPVGVKFAERGYIKGKIIYRDGSKGTLILLKTTMIKDLDIRLKGYKGAHPDFPDQSTTDQFFDEEQFEAYRELGYEIAKRMINEVDLQELLNECR